MKVSFSPVFGYVQPQSWAEFLSDSVGKSYFAVSISGEKALQYRPSFSSVFTQAAVTSALELHQICQEAIRAAEDSDLHIELVAGFFDFEAHRCSICAIEGSVLLKRTLKVGQILVAEPDSELKIIEGKLQLDDVFVFVLNSALTSIPVLESQLPKIRNIDLMENDLAKTMRQATQVMSQPLLVELQMTSGDQAEPPLTASQIIADGDSVTPEKYVLPTEAPVAGSANVLKKGVSAFMSVQQLVRSFFSKDVYVRRQATKQLIRVLVPVLLIIGVVIGFIVFQTVQKQQELKRAATIIQPIETQLKQIKETIKTNPLQARQQTEDLIVQLDSKMKQESSRKTTTAALQAELTNIKNYYTSISGLDEFPVLLPFYDLRLVKSDFIANRMSLQDNTLIFLDSGQGKIIALDTEKKQWTDIPAGDAAQMKDIELMGQNAYVMGNGLYRINLSNSSDIKLLKENNDLLQNATGMRLYQQYIYVISIAQNNIFRFSKDDKDPDKLSDPIGWLHQPIVFDLNTIQSFAIDGDVWIGTKTGEIKKFTSGSAEDFTITGLKDPFANPIMIYTQEDQQNLYILEPAKERVVILNKQGVFQREIKSPTLATTTSLVANEKTKKGYVLSGALIFQIDL